LGSNGGAKFTFAVQMRKIVYRSGSIIICLRNNGTLILKKDFSIAKLFSNIALNTFAMSVA
jgi:hypothetical protein